MQVHKIADGRLRVLITDKELSRLGTDFSSLKERDPHTKVVIRRILQLVYVKEGFQPGTTLTVEAAPVDGGCLLLITPTPFSPPHDGIHIFAPQSAAVLPMLADICARAAKDSIVASSLYAYEGGYRLILYAPHLPAHVAALLAESAPFVGGGKIRAAHITEYGTPLFIGEALERM